MKISATIFDLNGTILEDEDEYGKSFNQVLQSLGIDSKTDYPQEKGIGVKENWVKLIEKYGIKTQKTPEMLVKETQDSYLSKISEVTVRSGFDDFVEGLKDSGVKIGLATSNSWEVAEALLSKVGLQGVFDEMTTIEEVVYSKPDPSLFTITADKLGVERDECLVIEDSLAGITAAHNAGMKVIAIATGGVDPKLVSSADLVVESFSEITPKIIDQL